MLLGNLHKPVSAGPEDIFGHASGQAALRKIQSLRPDQIPVAINNRNGQVILVDIDPERAPAQIVADWTGRLWQAKIGMPSAFGVLKE